MSRLERHRPNWTAILAVVALFLAFGSGPAFWCAGAKTAGVNVLLVIVVIMVCMQVQRS